MKKRILKQKKITSIVRQSLSIISKLKFFRKIIFLMGLIDLLQQDCPPSIIFVFPGEGTQYVNMGKKLLLKNHIYRTEYNRCVDFLKSKFAMDLSGVIIPKKEKYDIAIYKLNGILIAHLAIFIVSYSLAKQLIYWGIQPKAMIGYGLGEFVAACLSGVISLEDTLEILFLKGKLMQSLPSGYMLSVSLPLTEVNSIIREPLNLASIKSNKEFIITGSEIEILKLYKQLKKKKVNSQILKSTHALNSSMIDPILGLLKKEINKKKLNTPKIPFISNLTGEWIREEQAKAPQYWINQIRNTIQFSKGISTITESPGQVYLEVGPASSIIKNFKVMAKFKKKLKYFHSMPYLRGRKKEKTKLFSTLVKLWKIGVIINWKNYFE